MTITKVEAYDPGKITGYALGAFDEETPLELVDAGALTYEDIKELRYVEFPIYNYCVVERFDLADNDFKADLTGVRVEGMIDMLNFPHGKVVWRSRTKKEQVPDVVLREHGLWQTGGEVDWEDGRDANDAIIHLLGFVAFDLRHIPTLRKYFKPNYGKAELRA